MNIKDLIFELCSLGGVSGSEEPVAQKAKQLLQEYSEVSIDKNGNVIATLGNKFADKTILLDAHLDRIGLMVTAIDDNGFVKVDKCGGIDTRTLQNTEMFLQKKPEITGVVCCMPPHLTNSKEDKATPIDKTWIDFGLTKEEAEKNIEIGDVISFCSTPALMLNNRVCSACLDDRCGVACLIECAKRLKEYNNLPYKVIILLSVQEETFETGAKTGAFSVDIDEAIAVDVSFASQPDVTGQYSNINVGKGTMIAISPVLNKAITNKLINIAKTNNIPYQLEPLAGTTGTNADCIAVTKTGVKTSVISIPQKNMHTQNEIISLDDVENTVKLICDYIISGGAF